MKKCLLALLCFIPCVFANSPADHPTIQGKVVPIVTMDQSQHHVLREIAKPVTFPLNQQAQQTIANLKATFASLASPYGKPAGLAAPQIGVPLRIIIIQIPSEAKQRRREVFDTLPPTVFINPSFTPIKSAGLYRDWEGCYSVPNKMGEVDRYFEIELTAYTQGGIKIHRVAKGFLARLLQHEIDHLNGKDYVDHHCQGCRFGDEKTMLALSRAK